MAQSTAFLTYDAVGNRESLSDIISVISPTDTPMFSNFGKASDLPKARYAEWTVYELVDPAANAQIEGADWSYTKPSASTRTGSYAQIFTKTFPISRTQEVVAKAGLESEYKKRLEWALKEIKTDVEYAFVNATGNSGASGTARTTKGVLAWVATNVVTGTGTGTETLTENMFNDALALAYAEGGKPNHAYCNTWQKRKISAFSANNTRYSMSDDKTLVPVVNFYESEFGKIEVTLDRYMPTDKVVVLQDDQFETFELDPLHVVDNVAQTIDGIAVAVRGEIALVSRNEKASCKITELAVT